MARAAEGFCWKSVRIWDRISYNCMTDMPAMTVEILSCEGPVYSAFPSSEFMCVAAAPATSRPMGCGKDG